ncbi:uncharacterized protein [Palaemon carinicauda]|uniref:uncharacterized protein n=1 Tax=Palaemon carinicauda TaxID=392227 RepID=UPI0035B5BB75
MRVYLVYCFGDAMRMILLHKKRIISLVLVIPAVISSHVGYSRIPQSSEWHPAPAFKNVTSLTLEWRENVHHNTGIQPFQGHFRVDPKELFRFQRETKKRRASHTSKGYRDDRQNLTVVEAQVGKSASINCYTKYKGDVQVSWLRPDMGDILTVGPSVFSRSGRYELRKDPDEGLWQLIITNVRDDDEGTYECQMATSNEPVSLFFNLTVKESKAVILGPPEVTLYQGQRLELNCTVMDALDPPRYVMWLLNGSVVPRMVAKTTPFSKTLRVMQVGPGHSGEYSCDPYLAIPATVRVKVIGEKDARKGSRMRDMGLDTDLFENFGMNDNYDPESADDWIDVYMQEPSAAAAAANRLYDHGTTFRTIGALQAWLVILAFIAR